MKALSMDHLQTYRRETFNINPSKRIKSEKEAVRFVNQRGFIFFWPIKGVTLPSLWTATAGDRPVPNDHEDPGQITWRWKDDSLGKKVWYYGKILRRKATFISLEIAPYFYALSENYGSPEEDYLVLYERGELTQAAKNLYETLLDKGPLDTIALRKEARLLNAKESVFNRALEDLQMDFKILPVGIAEVGSWKYAFIYEITTRHFPELPERARMINEADARQKLVELYFLSIGAAPVRDVTRLFGWPAVLSSRTVQSLVDRGKLLGGVTLPGNNDEYFSVPELG